MKKLLILFKDHILEVVLIMIFGFLFFYRLDWITLGSWDEAWYGAIARTISQTNEWMLMQFNGEPYFDHPPMGFWLMAISYKLFGVSEFSTRLPSAFLGLMSMILMYRTSVLLFGKKVVGFSAALILGTAVWYVLRVRSGNLDSPFVFFYILTIYLSLLSRKNMKLFPITMLAFGALMLTKTLVGVSALPVIGLILFSQLLKPVKHWKWILAGLASFAVLVLPWYYIQKETYSNFIEHHFFTIGTRGNSASSYLHLKYELPLFYLHMGVRKWYKLWILAGGTLLVSLKFLKPKIFIVLVWNAIILYPFLTTDETHIWHLIPVYIPLALITSYGIWSLGEIGLSIIKKTMNEKVIQTLYLIGIVIIASIQIKIFYHEVIPQSKYTPDDVDISMRVSQYDKTIFLDDDYLPLAVYYSNREIKQMAYEPEERKTLINLFSSNEQDFVAITRSWAVGNLDAEGLEYQILEQNESFSIVSRP